MLIKRTLNKNQEFLSYMQTSILEFWLLTLNYLRIYSGAQSVVFKLQFGLEDLDLPIIKVILAPFKIYILFCRTYYFRPTLFFDGDACHISYKFVRHCPTKSSIKIPPDLSSSNVWIKS
jgi:hypothetical protein